MAALDCQGERVLLIHPGIYDDYRSLAYPPWGIVTVGSACKAAGADVALADLNGQCIPRRIEELVELHQPTVVGITGKLGNGARRMRSVVDALKVMTDVPIGIGGPLVSAFPDQNAKLWKDVSALFWGEGELVFPQWIASGCPSSGLMGPTPPRTLDSIGIPTWWKGLGEYVSDAEWWPGLEVRSMHVSVSRGCTRRCTFCYLHQQFGAHGIRVISPKRILDGCDELNAEWNVRGFFFVDDCFVRPGHPEMTEFFELVKWRGSSYRFGCDLQLQELEDSALLEEMYCAGFRSLYVGVESASDEVRRRLGKGVISGSVVDVLHRALDMGFVIRASIGIGWPGETEAEMRATLNLIRKIPDLMFDAFRFTPLPGVPLTRFWDRTQQEKDMPKASISPFEDYSEFSRNYSELDDETMREIWEEMRFLEQERHQQYFRGGITSTHC